MVCINQTLQLWNTSSQVLLGSCVPNSPLVAPINFLSPRTDFYDCKFATPIAVVPGMQYTVDFTYLPNQGSNFFTSFASGDGGQTPGITKNGITLVGPVSGQASPTVMPTAGTYTNFAGHTDNTQKHTNTQKKHTHTHTHTYTHRHQFFFYYVVFFFFFFFFFTVPSSASSSSCCSSSSLGAVSLTCILRSSVLHLHNL
jgi:hypothetical protein